MWSLLALVGACDGDPGPIEFSNLRVEELGSYRAVIRFETSRESTCHVLFGASPDALDSSATDPSMEPGTHVIEHEVPLEDLAPDTLYYFAAQAIDRDENEYLSDTDDLTTAAGTPVDEMTNVALVSAGVQIAQVSSNYAGLPNESGWGANNAIDGRMTTEWSSDGDGDAAFLELDLGAPRVVQFIGFRSRKMEDGTSIVEKFELLVDGETVLGPYETLDPDVRYVIELDEPVSMQTVRMSAVETTGGNTGLKELQLFVP